MSKSYSTEYWLKCLRDPGWVGTPLVNKQMAEHFEALQEKIAAGTVGYMCLVDLECELGAAKDGNVVYPSERNLQENRSCVVQCGIAKVRVLCDEVIQEANYSDLLILSKSTD